MARTTKTPKRGKPFRFHLDLTGEMAIRVDEKVQELRDEAEKNVPGSGTAITRSEVCRRAIWAYVK